MVKFAIKMIDLHEINVWKWGLYHACVGGHIEIVKLMIEKIQSIPAEHADWDLALEGACEGGRLEIVQLIIIISNKSGITNDWHLALKGACHGGHADIIEFIIKKT